MKILLVVDQFFGANNGMTVSAQRFASVLSDHGHQVRVVCSAGNGEACPLYVYALPEQHIPFFDGLIASEGMRFARPQRRVLEEAVAWADVVHLYLPFVLSHETIRICRRLGKPCTAGFHVQPENISATLGLARSGPVNRGLYRMFDRYVYRWCGHIHCPSRFIADELRQNGYRSELHVISNGVDPAFRYRKLPKTPELEGKFVILSVGRLSAEKRQDVIIDAVLRSRHQADIQLVLAGQGPRRRAICARGARLTHPPVVQFFEKPQLLDQIARSDLYVHAASAEIEAMSCMEAFAGGLVPVIADSPKSATPQFALDERSLFRVDDPADLARKIDYWIEHPEERREMERRYSALAERYRLDDCVREAEDMFRAAVRDAGGGTA